MAKAINEYFHALIYKPILDVLRQVDKGKIKLNAIDPANLHLMKKIQDGEILYDGEFMLGRFDARAAKQIRDLGGQWDPFKSGYRFSPGKLTPNLKTAISASKERLKQVNDGLMNVLGEADNRAKEALELIDLDAPLDEILKGLQVQTVKAMDNIGVKYTLTHGQKETIKKEYRENMDIYIKYWTEEHIKTLRKDVEANSMAGYRFSKLKDTLEHRYGTSKSKAEFLARNETSFFIAKFRQQRFMDAGVKWYKWQTVGDQKVRDDHRLLNKRIFQFGDPPIIDSATGKRGEPGETYNCRCIARPITRQCHKVGGEWQIVD
ncbi:MAG: minor capsid protein [Desulfobacteraceae bacterium]|nr:minor capsid protein [Desulfobacteraceae bacterium]